MRVRFLKQWFTICCGGGVCPSHRSRELAAISIRTALGWFDFSVDFFFGCTPWFLRGAVVVGSRLLSADADGHIKCWSMTDHLANSWENTVGSMVEGDPVVALSWLHNGVKLALHVEKVCPSSAGDPVRKAGSSR